MNNCLICGKETRNLFCSSNCRKSEKGRRLELQRRKEYYLKKYGVTNPSQLPKVKEQKRQKAIEKYGCDNPMKNKEVSVKMKQTIANRSEEEKRKIQEKRIQTTLEIYGTKCHFQSDVIKEQIKQTNLKKYGCENPFANEEVKKKIKNTFENHYIEGHPLKSKIIREKIKQTNIEIYGVDNPLKSNIIKEKIKKTNQGKYGVEWVFNSEIIKEKIRKRNLEKYGVENPFCSGKIQKSIKNHNAKQYYNNHILNLKIVKPLFTLEEYVGGKIQKYKWQCIKCSNVFEGYVKNGLIPRCLICDPILYGTSHTEREIQNWLEQYILIERNKRFYENKKYKYELDVWIPLKNIGIEYNDLYTHSEISGGKHPAYHLEKSEYFLNKDIQVVHIFGNEWYQKQDIVKSIILAKLGLIKEKIFARKCEIKEISHKDSEKFLNENHIQGSINSKIRLGLFLNNELISLMTLGKPRYNKKYEYELLRYCNKLNTNVIGGFSKLLSYFLKTYNSKSLMTYADRRFSTGNVYLKNGFKLTNISGPNYFYMKDHFNLESRISYQKYKLSKIFPIFDCKLTEWENMQLNGYDRIWDCGNLIFQLK
jgi:Tfp pilus assembly major pilin PilA